MPNRDECKPPEEPNYGLLFHDTIDTGVAETSGFNWPGADLYKLSPDSFKQHLEAIATAVEPVVCPLPSPTERSERHAPGFPFSITFDDGGISNLHAAAVLEEFGWRGWFFLVTEMLGEPGFLGPPQVRELRRRGHIIGTHTHTHPFHLNTFSPDAIRREWVVSKRRLEEILEEEVSAASVPGGFYSPEVARVASEAGLRMLFTSEPVSHTWRVGQCTVIGRYSITRRSPPSFSAQIVSGARVARLSQRLSWSARKMAKRLLGPVYSKIRERLLR